MKYLKLFEQINNYKVEVMDVNEFSDFYYGRYGYHGKHNLKDKLQYFSYGNLDTHYGGEKHNKSKRFIVAYNDKDILGVGFFAWYDINRHYAISQISTNKDYFNQGISKRILEELFKYFSETYTETLYFSGYSIDGWKYLRKSILNLAKKYNVNIKEKAIEFITDWEENREEKKKLYKQSRKDIRDKYGEDYVDMLGYWNIDE